MHRTAQPMTRRLISILVTMVILLTFHGQVEAEFDVIAESAILMEATTGTVLFEKNADEPLPPASITKVMTLLLAFEAIERGDVTWDEPVIVSENAWRMARVGSVMFLELGRAVEFEQIVYGISIVSANDGCVALAEHLFGTEEAFVQEMNRRAQELGLTNTRFQNSHGLPADDHYMSARDIAILSSYLINTYPRILEIESQESFTYDPEKYAPQANRNPLLGTFPGADGLKTGWTTEAGYCLVGTAQRDNMRLISVVLRTESNQDRLIASSELLTYGFSNYERAALYQKGDVLKPADVRNGKELTVPIQIASDVEVLLPKNQRDNISVETVLSEEALEAPIEKNTIVGALRIFIEDEMLAEADIITAEAVERAGFFELLWRSIRSFFSSLFRIERA